jgi:hypothetical protein
LDLSFGRLDSVDPVRHLIASAAAKGDVLDYGAFYLNAEPGLPFGECERTKGDVGGPAPVRRRRSCAILC